MANTSRTGAGTGARTGAGENLRINSERLWESLMEMAQIGPGVAGGNNRQALTDADNEGRHLFRAWAEAAGMAMGVDQMGNMFFTRPGEEAEAAPVFMGSHLDTQPTGGKYDGVLGVLGALEAVRTMNDLGIRTKHPITVVNWSNEEGARFAPAMVASGVFAGVIAQDHAWSRQDPEGKRFGDELRRIGWLGGETTGARKIHAYYELHIEQGPILEAESVDIGVVTHGQGLWWLEFTLTGRDAHTGSTPMAMRKNAGLAMARIFELVQDVAMANQPDAVGGVGQVRFAPNSRNVLPGVVVFTVDIRTVDLAKLNRMRAAIEDGAAKICAALDVGCAVEAVGHFDPVTFTPDLVGSVRRAAERLGYSHRDIVSGAGHDACWIARVAPTTMIFCPCEGGLSHNEAEAISPEWAAAGTDVLLHAVLETAQVVA
ncbi:Zn-dependent hydrolase [Paracoccus sp. IB05]|uniref:Zn-dependent hydrolase n=1 Tax=Paracoccus sp. IB05 TaxID=2779367 RepID=UPI0018E82819|nr:Zn-dependent hydrolase [Paracoccus sp. IB05]MBJ2151682.1 Zn-dependent hydrolase [Paracoccus sp. IB05]